MNVMKAKHEKVEGPFFKVFRFLARLIGFIWILGGLVFLSSSFLVAEHKVLYAGVGVLFFMAGLALILAKPVAPKDLERFRRFVDRNKNAP